MKALRITLVTLGVTLAALLALAGGFWIWAGTDTSLATMLNQAARHLPSGHKLEITQVQGSLREGGRIGSLRWQQGELSVELSDLRIAWLLRPLLDGEVRLSQLAAKSLRVQDHRPPSQDGPPTPLTELLLPIRVDTPFAIDSIELAGATPVKIDGLTGHYTFNSKEHILDVGQVQFSSGTYQIKGSLQAQSPMALALQLQGSVQTPVPSGKKMLTVQARADVTGNLAGRDAALNLQANLTPELKALGSDPVQASVTVRVLPWQSQPLGQATASWQALDVAALWPQAPHTQLSGEATVTPEGSGWRGRAKVTNALSGPGDKQRLPLQALEANILFAEGQLTIESLEGQVAGGQFTAQGKLANTTTANTQNADWRSSLNISGIDTAALDSRLERTILDGQLTAHQSAAGIAFKASVQPSAHAKPTGVVALTGLRIQSLDAQGLWRAPQLELTSVQLRTDDAQLQGNLTLNATTLAVAGQLLLDLPGARAGVNGNMAKTQGQGDLTLRVSDSAKVMRWLRQLPGVSGAVGQLVAQGDAEITAQWQGGWQRQGQDMAVKAQLRTNRLELRESSQKAAQAWRLRDVRTELSGTLQSLKISAQGLAENADRQFSVQLAANGGQLGEGVWQGQLESAQLSVQDGQRSGPWTAKLGERLRLDWKQRGDTRSLQASGGTLRLTGPDDSAATVSWKPAQWSQQSVGKQLQTRWQSQGSLQGLPLAWVDLLDASGQMAKLGLKGDLLFGGEWTANGGDSLKVQATLARTNGDLQLQTEETGAEPLHAGLRDVQLKLTVEGEQAAAKLVWDSERAGWAQADVQTRLRHQGGAWTLSTEAPLAGTITAKLPPVSAWSMLAPPGWRMRGTLDADAVLSGTLGAPQWRGTLRAQDLALRSVVDGIDFSGGTLQARLDGDHLELVDFTLQGAGGQSGGRLGIKGSVTWPPASGAATPLASRLRMELSVQATGLRLSSRPDRRLALSGHLSAQLLDTRLSIRGTLTADQALFILPESTTPQLGDDVVVRTAGQRPAAALPAPGAKIIHIVPDVAVTIDLGPDFQVRGHGLKTRVMGKLDLRSAPGGKILLPRLSGDINTVGGNYKAYGQELDIEEGVLRFFGPFDNPSLNILAIRPKLQQRVGVQINGTALSPVVRLYAEPDLPDAEKLAWLVLGRAGSSGGAEAAVLQQAALALLGGNGQSSSDKVISALGLDELSVSGGATNADGTAGGATLTLGKRLSRDFYVSYEHSLASTVGTFNVFYDLSKRFTLRAQTGEQSAIDLIFTLRYD